MKWPPGTPTREQIGLEKTRDHQETMVRWLDGVPEAWEDRWEQERERMLYEPLVEDSLW